MPPLPVLIYHLPNCRGAQTAARVVTQVAARLGVAIDLQMILVETLDQARELRFPGSPTVRIGGQDVEPAAHTVDYYGFA